jgi:hypothetical protein
MRPLPNLYLDEMLWLIIVHDMNDGELGGLRLPTGLPGATPAGIVWKNPLLPESACVAPNGDCRRGAACAALARIVN